ncbi:hypothetical protein IT570_07590 [Candidatus Sumerlaeota bacterium]|nr:hypothetical protein [Candidatus Sumerlaeota bacterium]
MNHGVSDSGSAKALMDWGTVQAILALLVSYAANRACNTAAGSTSVPFEPAMIPSRMEMERGSTSPQWLIAT